MASSWRSGSTSMTSVDGHEADADDASDTPASRRYHIAWTNVNQVHICEVLGEKDEPTQVIKLQWGSLMPKRRQLAFKSLPIFEALQQEKLAVTSTATGTAMDTNPWNSVGVVPIEHYLSYSSNIGRLLGAKFRAPAMSVNAEGVEREKSFIAKKRLEKAVWELVHIVYVQSGSGENLTESLVDWLEEHCRLLQPIRALDPTVYKRVMQLLQLLKDEEDPISYPEQTTEYWDAVIASVAVGWLDTAICLLEQHSALVPGEQGRREEERGIVQVVITMLKEMPLLRLSSARPALAAGTPFDSLPEYLHNMMIWRTKLSRLETVEEWQACSEKTSQELARLINRLLGEFDPREALGHWMEMVVVLLLRDKPNAQTVDSIEEVVRRCIRSIGSSEVKNAFDRLLKAILFRETETVLSECSKLFDSWMMVHLSELLCASDVRSQEVLLRTDMEGLGGMSLQEMYRLQYAQELLSHGATWQLAPAYLLHCPHSGGAVLRTALTRLPLTAGDDRLALKALDVCRQLGLEDTATAICRIMGVRRWKQGLKGSAVAWLQRAGDDARLTSIAHSILRTRAREDRGGNEAAPDDTTAMRPDNEPATMFDNILRTAPLTGGTFGFLQRFLLFEDARDRATDALQWAHEEDAEAMTSRGSRASPEPPESASDSDEGRRWAAARRAGQEAATQLLRLLDSGAAPERYWFLVLQSGAALLDWPGTPLIGARETAKLISRLQELLRKQGSHLGRGEDREDEQLLDAMQLKLAQNLSRAILGDC